MRSITLILFVVLIYPQRLLAQSPTLNITQLQTHIANGLNKNYHPDSVTINSFCGNGCIFIKFGVSKQGRIAGLSFSGDSTLFIRQALTSAVYILQKDKALIKTLQRSGRTIIQPFIYRYERNCGPHKIDYPNTPEGELQFNKAFITAYIKKNHADQTLLDMLNFTDGKLKALDCILLTPMGVMALQGAD